jgi:hypothetical protein
MSEFNIPSEVEEYDREIEKQAQLGQSFSLAAMIGREGANLLNSQDAIPKNLQILNHMAPFWQGKLKDTDGALEAEFLLFLKDFSETKTDLWDDPHGLFTQSICFLLIPENLEGFVSKVDARWGKMFDEKPFFESIGAHLKPNHQAHPEDPYTLKSVALALQTLL